MKRRSIFHWGRKRLFVLPKVILTEQEFEAGCFKSFSCLGGCQIPCGLLNGCVLYPAHPSGHLSCLIPNTSNHMWSIVPSEDQVDYNICLAISHASTHQKLALVKWISIQFSYKVSMNHTKIHVIFLQLTRKPSFLLDKMHVNNWTGCEQKTADKEVLLPINNMACVIIRGKTCETISLMFLTHVSLPQAPGPTTSGISFEPQCCSGSFLLCHRTFLRTGHLLVYVDLLLLLSHRSHSHCSATGGSPCL